MPKVPRYSQFKPASALASTIKKSILNRDTKTELELRRELWRRGLRYRVSVSRLLGKPDIVFWRARVVVFCDGDFWHGRDWTKRQARLRKGANAAYWTAKIASNVERDRRISRSLRMEGWLVLRFWESDIAQDVASIADRVATVVLNREQRSSR